MHQPEHVEDQSIDVTLERAHYIWISTWGTLIFTEYCLWHEMSKREKFSFISHKIFIKIKSIYFQRCQRRRTWYDIKERKQVLSEEDVEDKVLLIEGEIEGRGSYHGWELEWN